MSTRDSLGQYRLRRLALQLRDFTVSDLEAAAGVSTATVHNFVHELADLGADLITTTPTDRAGPGRRPCRYILTPKGLRFLAEKNLGVAQELNRLAFEEDEPLRPKHAIETWENSRSERPSTNLRINEIAPDFTAETTQGTIAFHEWIGSGWAILFSHPKDFNPVSTTELGYMAGLRQEFAKRNCKIIGLSADPASSYNKWAADIEETQGHKVTFPMISDPELKIAKLYNMLPASSETTSEGCVGIDSATVRTVYVIGPDKKIKLMLSYPMSTGRNFDEILRALDSIQLTAKHRVATPVNWKKGDDVIILSSVPEEEARQKFPGGWKASKPYLRVVAEPK